MVIALIAVGLVAGSVVGVSATDSRPDTYSFFASADASQARTRTPRETIEVGLRFSSSGTGTLNAVRFLKARGDVAHHRVTVWSADGSRLATALSADESRSGWQEVALAQPVQVQPGQSYVVSYRTNRYEVTRDYFSGPLTAGPLSLSEAAAVYAYGDGQFPTRSWRRSNYWVDVVFQSVAAGPALPTPTPTPSSPSPSATPAPTASPTPVPTPTTSTPTAPPSVLALPRVPWEGGPSYYDSYTQAKASGWSDPKRFPIGVWYESVLSDADAQQDVANGLNTYVELTADSDLSAVRRNGMSAIISQQYSNRGNESVAWLLGDEVDMTNGPGSGYTEMQRLLSNYPANDGRMHYANFGKGVTLWESDSEAGKFVNDYTTAVSNDLYWYTDPYICPGPGEDPPMGVTAATCRRAANYGLTMDRMRYLDGLDGKRQPIYAFVEVGHPFTQADAPTITAEQIAGAVMNSLIHEARGVIYFNHDFGGPCISQHVLRDQCGDAVRPTVRQVNTEIATLAPVLNTQSYKWTANPGLDTMLKAYDGSYYLFAMPGRTGGTGSQELTLPAGLSGSSAEVLFEGRSVPISGGAIQDVFAKESSYHIYKITP